MEYPAAFGENALVGGLVTSDVLANQAYLFVPNKLLITNLSIRRSEIASVFLDNAELFEVHHDGEYLSLIVFIVYEILKGDKSFWKPYFDVFPNADVLGFWSDAELSELQDSELTLEALRYRKELDEEWEKVAKIFKKYPKLFPQDKVSKDLFTFVYGNVVTRCFGWNMPCTMMIPVADSLNHAPVDCSNEMCDVKLHEEAAKGAGNEQYATKDRMALDLSDLTKTHVKTEAGKMQVKDLKIGEDTVEVYKDNESLTFTTTQYNIWNVYLQVFKRNRGFYSSSATEDSDTEESEPQEETKASGEDKFPKCSVAVCSLDKTAYCILSFEESDAKSEIENFAVIADTLEGEIAIDKHTKYKVVRSKKEEDDTEDYDWYDPDSATTYACLATNNAV